MYHLQHKSLVLPEFLTNKLNNAPSLAITRYSMITEVFLCQIVWHTFSFFFHVSKIGLKFPSCASFTSCETSLKKTFSFYACDCFNSLLCLHHKNIDASGSICLFESAAVMVLKWDLHGIINLFVSDGSAEGGWHLLYVIS